MKCSNCGYTSFDDLETCKKCGAALTPRSLRKNSGAIQPRLTEAIEPLAEEEELEIDAPGEELTPAEIAAHLAEQAERDESEDDIVEDESEDEELGEPEDEDREIQLLADLDLDADEDQVEDQEEEELRAAEDMSEADASELEQPPEASAAYRPFLSSAEHESVEQEPEPQEQTAPEEPIAAQVAQDEAEDETDVEASAEEPAASEDERPRALAYAREPETEPAAEPSLIEEEEEEEEVPIPVGQMDWREELKLRVQRIKKKKEAKLRRMQAAQSRGAWPDHSSLATARQLPLAEPEETQDEPDREPLRTEPQPREPLRIHHRTLPPPAPPPPPTPARPAARYLPPPPEPAIRPEPPEHIRPRRMRPRAAPLEPPEPAVRLQIDPALQQDELPAADMPAPLLFESEGGFDLDRDPTSIPEEMVRAGAMRTAGASKRFWAALYDLVFLFLINLAVVWGTGQVLGTTVFQVLKSSIWTVAPLLALVDLGYFLFFTGASGETFGKLIMKLRVVSMDGGPCNFRQAAFRTLGYLLSSVVAGLGFLWICWDDNDQGWHDKLAHTLVLDRN